MNNAEHHTIVNIQGDVAGIKKDLLQVEMVAANNRTDIVKLKTVK